MQGENEERVIRQWRRDAVHVKAYDVMVSLDIEEQSRRQRRWRTGDEQRGQAQG